ncbi:carboxypeptidase M32 [Candidatus Curtissbacteria bacterium]|nr:carboxypeptidase M32 [Candidatus Curtissbacteria bacterium]
MKLKNPVVKKLCEKYKTVSLLNHIDAILGWDLNVNLPPKGGQERGQQIAFITKQITDIFNDKDFKNLVEESKTQRNLTPEEKAILRNLHKASEYYDKVPAEIITEKSKTTSEAYMAWQKAKQDDKFGDFLPHLKKLIELDQIIAGHIGYRENPLDALLDLHEPDLTASFCKKNIVALQPGLTALIKRIQSKQKFGNVETFVNNQQNYAVDAQRQLALYVSRKMGYDLDAGRIDVSAHPFTTTPGRQDVRITNFYKEHDFRDSFSSTMHETGHALYEQNINQDYDQTPLEWGVSYGIHEALSRFWENQIGKNPHFLTFMTPLFQAFFPEQLKNTSHETFIKLFNLPKPGFIRIEADEVTYTLHIIIRFEIEDALINNKLKPKDLPEAWRAKMKKYLGVVPQTDRDGVLQDMHWAGGSFGYFPAYALGNLYASQFLHYMKKEIDVDGELEKGHLGSVLYWLNENVHKHGSRYWPDELVKVATGESLNPKYFLNYLSEKFTGIYG